MALSRQAQAPGRADLRLLAAAVDMPPLKSVRLLGPLKQQRLAAWCIEQAINQTRWLTS
jgi:hypothetical protein